MFEVYTYPVELAAAVAFFILIQRLRTALRTNFGGKRQEALRHTQV
jgi:hypothetical protein